MQKGMDIMKKRLLSTLLALCMVFTLMPVSDMAAESSSEAQARWGIAGTEGLMPAVWAGSGSFADAVTYANGLSSGTAYIQLQSDVNAAVVLTFTKGTTTLDLNNCTLTGSNTKGVITLNNGAMLSITDNSIDKNQDHHQCDG